jgi:hypothetical protein
MAEECASLFRSARQRPLSDLLRWRGGLFGQNQPLQLRCIFGREPCLVVVKVNEHFLHLLLPLCNPLCPNPQLRLRIFTLMALSPDPCSRTYEKSVVISIGD